MSSKNVKLDVNDVEFSEKQHQNWECLLQKQLQLQKHQDVFEFNDEDIGYFTTEIHSVNLTAQKGHT